MRIVYVLGLIALMVAACGAPFSGELFRDGGEGGKASESTGTGAGGRTQGTGDELGQSFTQRDRQKVENGRGSQKQTGRGQVDAARDVSAFARLGPAAFGRLFGFFSEFVGRHKWSGRAPAKGRRALDEIHKPTAARRRASIAAGTASMTARAAPETDAISTSRLKRARTGKPTTSTLI